MVRSSLCTNSPSLRHGRPLSTLTGRLESTDFVEEPSVLAPALGICGDVSEADSWLFASCGEDGRRDRNELRQLSEVLGGGGQQELIFGSTRPTQAQSIQPEDALQMSEEHLDLLSFAT